jgi:hypothetical protein
MLKKPSLIRERMTINYYFRLRLKQFFRILKEIGFIRSLFLLSFLALIFYLLAKIDQRLIVPIAIILGLMFYHNERKDKDFLLLQTKHAASLLRIEYLFIGLPFIIIECLKTYFFEAGIIVITAILLPELKTIKWKSFTIKLPFLYKGGLEYIRMFRLYGWLYFFLFLIAVTGSLHDNIRIGKVALIVWGIIQATAFTSIPQRQELTFFLNYSSLQKYLIRSNAWNVTVTSIPLIGIIFSFSFVWENIIFSACAMVGSMLYLWNLGMIRHLLFSTVAIAIYQLIILIPLFFYSCFIPFLLIPFALINGVCYILLKNNTKQIWN